MTQIESSKVILRNLEQAETIINNLAKVRHFKKVELLFAGKPSFSQENLQLLKTKYNIDAPKITKLASEYRIYKLSEVEENESCKMLRKFNSNIQIKNLQDREEIVIYIDQDHYDKYFFLALIGLYPKFGDIINKQCGYKAMTEEEIKYVEKHYNGAKHRYFDSITETRDCLVSIITRNQSTVASRTNLDTSNLLPCSYRIMSGVELYPLLGSTERVMGSFTKDYELCKFEKPSNGRGWSKILDTDIVTKIMNGVPGDLINCKILLSESKSCYYEYAIREVIKGATESDIMTTSGLHLRYKLPDAKYNVVRY